MRVLVLCGGESAERIVSHASGDAVATWIEAAGHTAIKYDPEKPGAFYHTNEPMAPPEIGLAAPLPRRHDGYDPTAVRGLLDAIDGVEPDVIFPILHGGRGEDGTLQALLEWTGVPYTGSGVLASSVAMNKLFSRTLFQSAGIPVAEGVVLRQDSLSKTSEAEQTITEQIGFPVVVKPLCGGSTVGLTKVYAPAELEAALHAVHEQHDDALVERLFEGRELTVTVVDHEAYPVIEIRPKVGFYDYANKYTAGRTEYLCPAPIANEITLHLQSEALKAFSVLGCEGFARVDFLLDERGESVCLEVNTLPGMTHHSLVPKAARARGEEPPVLMQRIMDCALRDCRTTRRSEAR